MSVFHIFYIISLYSIVRTLFCTFSRHNKHINCVLIELIRVQKRWIDQVQNDIPTCTKRPTVGYEMTEKQQVQNNQVPTSLVSKSLNAHYCSLVLQRKPFAFELFFCWANAGFFTFSSKTRSMVPTSNLCRNIQRPKIS